MAKLQESDSFEDDVSSDESSDIVEGTFCENVVVSSSDHSQSDLSDDSVSHLPRRKAYRLTDSDEEDSIRNASTNLSRYGKGEFKSEHESIGFLESGSRDLQNVSAKSYSSRKSNADESCAGTSERNSNILKSSSLGPFEYGDSDLIHENPISLEDKYESNNDELKDISDPSFSSAQTSSYHFGNTSKSLRENLTNNNEGIVDNVTESSFSNSHTRGKVSYVDLTNDIDERNANVVDDITSISRSKHEYEINHTANSKRNTSLVFSPEDVGNYHIESTKMYLLNPEDSVEKMTNDVKNLKTFENTVSKHSDQTINLQRESLLAEKERLSSEISEVTNAMKTKSLTLRTVDLNILPDKGMKLKISLSRDERILEELNEQYKRVTSSLSSLSNVNNTKNIKKGFAKNLATLPSVNVEDMGRTALKTFNAQQSLTVNSLKHMHNSLKTCPSDDVVVDDPSGLKLPLMLHQQQALSWLLWREKERPRGGILADDMGLGKTLTMISLVLKVKEIPENPSDSDDDSDDEDNTFKKFVNGGTLIVCPSSLIGQWEFEIQSKVKSGEISAKLFHGLKRERKARRLARYDVVITSYAVVRVECEKRSIVDCESESVLYAVRWNRIILDEAHTIRNHKSKTSVAVCELKGKCRWALTGTPIHNKMQDFYSLLKFLRCKPFNDINVWKKWVEAKDETGTQRLNMLTKTLLLRRTKGKLMEEGSLQTLPEKSMETIFVQLGKEEMSLYEQVSNFSKTLLGQLLYQRAEKENLLINGVPVHKNKVFDLKESDNPFAGHPALNKMFNRATNMNNVKTHEILVLLLRLRQICCHPALMKSMIEKDTFVQDGIEDEHGTDVDLLEKMSSMSINEKGNVAEETADKKIWDLSNPMFNSTWKSSKISAIIKLLEENLLNTDDRIVIVSQWTSMLEILYDYLKNVKRCKCESLTGSVPVQHRMQIVNDFNSKSSDLNVLLLSMMAGGTGLNLVGGNHLILTDTHWNPQLELQACDRIYRVGQKKNVKIYKFICSETIEERIQLLQKMKLEMADTVLSGAKRAKNTQLSLNDLKMLFNVT